ncbi:hypothetical protein [Streptomyces sp. NPDC007856]|uniref:hypothetical protein n=1 Tax=Streptomyces sp. NPDC007856 TaxID=3364781 RepID=UPI0036A697B2
MPGAGFVYTRAFVPDRLTATITALSLGHRAPTASPVNRSRNANGVLPAYGVFLDPSKTVPLTLTAAAAVVVLTEQ